MTSESIDNPSTSAIIEKEPESVQVSFSEQVSYETAEVLSSAGSVESNPQGSYDGSGEGVSSQSSQSTRSLQEQEISIWLDEKEVQNEKRSTLNTAFSDLSGGRVSPLQSTLNTEWDDISVTQQKYYLRKAKELFQSTLSIISPGQEQQIWRSLRQDPYLVENDDSSKVKHFDTESELMDTLIKAHNEAQSWQTKRQILSLFANDFSRAELQTILPGLSKWRIDQARDHATKSGRGQPVKEKQIFRARISNEQMDHFLDFVSRPEFLQDVAFGTKSMKLDSGERITIPAVVRTLIPTRIIEQYLSYCKQEEFQSAGERSLYRMLDVCSASMQKSLQGLDNVTAEGTEAIDTLIGLVQELPESGVESSWQKEVEKQLKEAKRYLKTDFKTHVERQSNSSDHFCMHALSDPKKNEYQSECLHNHDVNCDRCESIDDCFQELGQKLESIHIDEEHRSRLKFDYQQCTTAIRAWKAHLLRTVVQEEAKQVAMNKLDKETCLIVIDWAMKFLPIKYRESMSEFFGKRGLSWHVSAVVTKSRDIYDVECFVHIFNSCTQNNYSVASILDHLFKTIKTEYPYHTRAYLRSDNAGCYHNGPLILYLSDIGTRTGISLLRYDFSDPQAGKDICDRKTAPMKAHIRRYVNEKNDVTSAEHMKEAIESHGGLKGCRVAVVKLDSSKDLPEDNKIPGISLLYNFSYEDDGIRTWKGYNIGLGLLLPYKDFSRGQRIEGVEEVLPFSPRTRDRGTVHSSSATKQDQHLFGCNEPTCVLTFKSEKEAQHHMDIGKHTYELESVSVYDRARMKWAERVTGISSAMERPTSSSVSHHPTSQATIGRNTPMGWALKVPKEKKRFEEKVKMFLIEKFDAGEKTNNKVDPLTVSKEMKTKRDERGYLLFQPEEWKTAQQIKSFFSRYSAKVRQVKTGELRGEELEEEERDIEVLETEMTRLDLRIAVNAEMNKPIHPIEVEEINICQLSNDGKLRSLKITQLKSICQSLQLKVDGSAARKKSYIDPLVELVRSCGCQE
ncbi:hypothetical protein AC249_AIPGENE4203 [Exaiptasia diaphana]|nr:hypothetical protein AC249_AIPGENE4203 [Exaiptasia diaphana]